LNGRVQVGQGGVGGFAEVIDPSKLEYDPRFGFLTTPDNIRGIDDANANRWDVAGMLAVGGAFGGAAMAAEAAAAAAAGSGGAGMVAPDIAAAGAGPGAATIPADIAVGGGLGGSSIPLVEMPGIVSAGEAGGGLAGLGAASGGGAGGAATGGLEIGGGGAGGVGAGGGVGSAGIRGGGGGGGSSDAGSIIEEMANANRVDHNTPLGSRRWAQGADGRWTVTDAMDPAEETNFRNVQGMNSDVTGMTRQRLADLLANPQPRQRYDRPLGT
jgi:hypothetical protein